MNYQETCMDIKEAIKVRHSVRQYLDKPIESEKLATLQEEIKACNKESDLHIQLIEDSGAFQGFVPRYGKFENVRYYFAMVGPKNDRLQELVGYYGQRLVLKAQMLGLNTCWVGGTFSRRKTKYEKGRGEKLSCLITLGYGQAQGIDRKTKSIEELSLVDVPELPAWFTEGMEAVQLAPTAINQQKFLITLQKNTNTDAFEVKAESLGGPYSNMDLGIVKYQFEVAAGTENFTWVE